MQNISVCLIGKNEANVLEKCLQALVPYPWEIVFTDTGSTDETKAIATRYTKNVYDFEWIGDFSAARNFCAEKASNDWILVIDCDEILDAFDYEAFSNMLDNHAPHTGTIVQRNVCSDPNSDYEHYYPADVFRIYNKKYYSFIYRIHEQLAPINPAMTSATFKSNLQVLHSGYALTPEENRAKQERNIALLEKLLDEGVDDATRPYFLFQLGLSYTNINRQKALDTFLQAFKYKMDPAVQYYKWLVVRTGETYQKLDRISEGYQFLHSHKKELEDFADFYYTLGFFEYSSGNIDEAIICYQKALDAPTYTNELAHHDGSHYNLGLLYLACDDLANAATHLEQCLKFKDAKERLGLAYYQYGKQLYDAGIFQEAMPFIQKASEYLEH